MEADESGRGATLVVVRCGRKSNDAPFCLLQNWSSEVKRFALTWQRSVSVAVSPGLVQSHW